MAVLVVSLLLVPLAAAHAADNGDGSLACNSGELCYSMDNPASKWQKHYWYSGNDSADGAKFVDTQTGSVGSTPVLNNASSMNNRDTACWVRVVDWNIDGTVMLAYQDFGNHPTTNSWIGFTSRMNDHNDAHLRCGSY